MILFFKAGENTVFAVGTSCEQDQTSIEKLSWALGDAQLMKETELTGHFIGPRKEMITPWSTNAMEITQNMGVSGIERIEQFTSVADEKVAFDPMLLAYYSKLDQSSFTIDIEPEPIFFIDDVAAYNEKEGLALNDEEISYLNGLSEKLGRKLTDSEVFGFSQVNSEHCRHKIFNGTFIIDGEEKERSLFKMIKETTATNPNTIVSAYKDNCSFAKGPKAEQFAPESGETAKEFKVSDMDTVLSLKAETHNFPTTVEPFNGAATGSGGEIRDRIAGGKASLPLAGTAVYMTAYPRTKDRAWEKNIKERNWLYQTPKDILIKASNGASDFGNKFGQPLICGSLMTFEHEENDQTFGFDKVIMLAGGIGFGNEKDALKDIPVKGQKVVLLGGENYRIGMGGGAVSSVDTGEFDNSVELNAVQRSNPEMQKRAYNVIRAFSEAAQNPIVSIHDHGAGGHLNCFSELVEENGGIIYIDKLPKGDKTLSDKEMIGNESQERMGLVIAEEDITLMEDIAKRERCPMYVVGDITNDKKFVFENRETGERCIDLKLEDFFGNPPKTIIKDNSKDTKYKNPEYSADKIGEYVENVLQLESVACKDWLTNKVDRSVTGKVARQQTVGEVQLPLSNCGASAVDYRGKGGIATAIGHAPVASMADPVEGAKLAIAESLTNIVSAPLTDKIRSISLSANWMWPCKNEGEDARLYDAVESVSKFACKLGINVPTGKDSMSMTQKYPTGKQVIAPGTVIISAAGEVSDVKKIVTPNIKAESINRSLIYVDFSKSDFELGGSSFAQTLNNIGEKIPTIEDTDYFANAFNALQELIEFGRIDAAHDVSSGGLITCLLEMCFPSNKVGVNVNTQFLNESDIVKVLFSEKPAMVVQAADEVVLELNKQGVFAVKLGDINTNREFSVNELNFDIDALRDKWFESSYLLDKEQSTEKLAKDRFENYKKQELKYNFGEFEGSFASQGVTPDRKEKSGVKAAIIREKGSNGDREMAYSMYLAGFDVRDVHMTDLMTGRETLEDVNYIVFVGGFSNSDVMGSAKGWAGAIKYNDNARKALENFYARPDTLSLGVCNGCQLLVELGYVGSQNAKMLHNESHKFESAFVGVNIEETNSVMLKSMVGKQLGIWVAHGEGKFSLSKEDEANVAMKYSYEAYPANPNGSDFATAGISSEDGRHLAMMPHLERAIFPWQWAHYPNRNDEVSPWIEAFVNARKWIEENR